MDAGLRRTRLVIIIGLDPVQGLCCFQMDDMTSGVYGLGFLNCKRLPMLPLVTCNETAF